MRLKPFLIGARHWPSNDNGQRWDRRGQGECDTTLEPVPASWIRPWDQRSLKSWRAITPWRWRPFVLSMSA